MLALFAAGAVVLYIPGDLAVAGASGLAREVYLDHPAVFERASTDADEQVRLECPLYSAEAGVAAPTGRLLLNLDQFQLCGSMGLGEQERQLRRFEGMGEMQRAGHFHTRVTDAASSEQLDPGSPD